MAKRHRWRRGKDWNVCEDCLCRFRRGNVTREYERRDGTRTTKAGECRPLDRDHKG